MNEVRYLRALQAFDTAADLSNLSKAAINRQGATLTRRLLVENDLASDRIVRLDDVAIPLKRAIYFVRRPGDADRSTIRRMRNWLFDICPAASEQ